MRKTVTTFWVLAIWIATATRVTAAPLSPEEIEAGFDAIVGSVVDGGWVDYAKLKADPAPLDSWLRTVEALPSIEVRKWKKDQAVAFYINAYNGHVLRIVRDHYPIEGTAPDLPASSIKQIEGVWQLPLKVAGRDLSLDAIEKDVLIDEYDAPRAHAALVCASLGSPSLKNSAYHGARLLRQLNLSAQEFIRSPRGARLDMDRKVLYVSPIFFWFEADFRKFGVENPLLEEMFAERAPMVQFVASYLLPDERQFIREADFRIEPLGYDWTLNDIANR